MPADSYTVKGDRVQFGEHVLGNLFKNLPIHAKGAQVTVSLSRRDGKILLSIKDTGRGITPEFELCYHNFP